MLDVVTLGETMVVIDPDETGSLKYIYRFNKKLAGAESNVAIGLSRLGFKTGWISRLGDDPHGEYIRSFIMGEADKNTMEYVKGFKVERVVDPIGAGDGFAAGFIAGQLKGYDLIKSTEIANVVGAFVVTVRGDVEGLPKVEELQVFMGKKEDVDR